MKGRDRISTPRDKITARTATYHDLSLLADAMKLIISADPAGATTGHEVLAAQALVGTTVKGADEKYGENGTRIRELQHLKDLCAKLQPGDAFTLNVDSDKLDRKEGYPISMTREINHFVILGKEKVPATGQDRPRIFLYDPYPRAGMSQYTYSGADHPDFNFFFFDEKGVWKSVLLVGHTKAP